MLYKYTEKYEAKTWRHEHMAPKNVICVNWQDGVKTSDNSANYPTDSIEMLSNFEAKENGHLRRNKAARTDRTSICWHVERSLGSKSLSAPRPEVW